jgi:hypothetical protein
MTSTSLNPPFRSLLCVEKFGAPIQALLQKVPLSELGTGNKIDSMHDRLSSLNMTIFPRPVVDATAAKSCFSGLWLAFGFLDESHSLSQNIDTIEGSLWHGIMHRREGDFSNAKYWMRQGKRHPIYIELAARVQEDCQQQSIAPPSFAIPTWNSAGAVDAVQSALRHSASTSLNLRRWLHFEWELLFQDCFGRAVGVSSSTHGECDLT